MSESFHARGGWWVVAQNTLMIASLVSAVIYRGHWGNLILMGAGISLIVVGAVFGITGVRALGKSLTPFPKPLERAALVTNGPYRWVRHPLYTSLILVCTGWSLCWASTPGLVAALVMAAVLNFKAVREERWLRECYPEYAAYKTRVRRLIPWMY
jgi:protein-S-isoprenylcysteine O-methyltransferase Ste14